MIICGISLDGTATFFMFKVVVIVEVGVDSFFFEGRFANETEKPAFAACTLAEAKLVFEVCQDLAFLWVGGFAFRAWETVRRGRGCCLGGVAA